jgi:hypothetical protein
MALGKKNQPVDPIMLAEQQRIREQQRYKQHSKKVLQPSAILLRQAVSSSKVVISKLAHAMLVLIMYMVTRAKFTQAGLVGS